MQAIDYFTDGHGGQFMIFLNEEAGGFPYKLAHKAFGSSEWLVLPEESYYRSLLARIASLKGIDLHAYRAGDRYSWIEGQKR